MKAIDLLSESIPPLRMTDTGATALRLMSEYHVRHLPIVNDQQLIGLISEEEILTAQGVEELIGRLPLTLQRPFIRDNEHAFEVIKLAAQFRLSVVPVIDQNIFLLMIVQKGLRHPAAEYRADKYIGRPVGF